MSRNVYSSHRTAGSRPRHNNSGVYSRPPQGRRRPAKPSFDSRLFIKPAKPVTSESYVARHAFTDFAVPAILARNIAAKGFAQPSPIQDQAIPMALAGKDVIGLANTGTGKTAAFAIPIADKLMRQPTSRALIIAPTRELAQQIEVDCRSFITGSQVYATSLIGGSSMWLQIKALQRRPQIVIGTPGRIKDHVERGNLDLSTIDMIVLDEVDRMLDMGFINDITSLLRQVRTDRQSLFFSATLDAKIESLIRGFSHDPVTISVKTGNTSDSVEQDIVPYRNSDTKIELLHDILNQPHVTKTLIFDETKRSVERLSQELAARGFAVDSIHGDKTQGQRKRALDRFRQSEVKILVATDVAARGIDVADITHVINYSTPQSYEDYIHRIGRAGRAGRAGYALTFVND